MGLFQILCIVISLGIAGVGTALFVRAIREMLAVIRVGQPASRTDNPAGRTVTLLKESLGHTRMLQWTAVGAAHWFIFIGFGLLFFTLLTAFGQLFSSRFALPLIGHFFLWEAVSEIFTIAMIIAIIGLLRYRLTRPKERVRGADGRFFGSTMWQAYFVEAVILGVGLCIVALRGLEYAQLTKPGAEHDASFLHFPMTFWLGEIFSGLSVGTLANLIYLIATIKIVISFVWMIVISLNLTMGVAWHRFLAFFNIYFKRESSGRTALGAMKPLTSAGRVVSLEDIEELDEDTVLGVGRIEDFSWKGILDFTSCTECGRCQSQCPAWNTEKPLSPKLLITALRDHAYAKAPYLQAAEGDREALLSGDTALATEAERPLVGDTGDDWFYNPESGAAVIDSEVLWNCTSCGACVQQCPVDIEHVDHIMDMRRHAVLVESNFPAELNGLFKGLENKGNPWNMNASARLDWTKGLDFEVKVVGEDIESLDEVEWLFWVGCAGAYEDRAKKTTRAVAELLDMAGVTFGVLGKGETCTGDPARRAGNEFVFQGLAQQNVEVLKEAKVKKVVSTCAHCFNTLKNEYRDFGIELEVVHHTQLLNRLVREGRLTPVSDGAGAQKRSITYHDPCFIGRHNGVYSPPRELLQILPGAELIEMERNSERSFCCGAGGARMWMEEKTGERINVNRTNEAVGTGADQIAVGCPFCRVMLSDGLTSAQAKGEAREEVEVLDVAQMLLASVKGEQATKLAPGAAMATATASGGAAGPASSSANGSAASAGGGVALAERDEATAADPEPGDDTRSADTVTELADAGPLAKASGGSSLFDTPAESADQEAPQDKAATASSEKSTPEEARAAKPVSQGGSLFDLGAGDSSESAQVPATRSEPSPAEPASAGSGGSLFDVVAPQAPAVVTEPSPTEPTTATEPAATGPDTATAAPAAAAPVASTPSLFDIASDEPTPPPTKPVEPATSVPPSGAGDDGSAAPASSGATATSTRSMFDIAAPSTTTAATVMTEPSAQVEVSPQKTEPESESGPGAPEAGPMVEPAGAAESSLPPEDHPSGGSATGASSGAASTPGTSIPEGGSLFDLEAPAAPEVARSAPEAEAAPEPEAQPEPDPEESPEESPAARAPQPETAPTSSGEVHEPRTDADISGSSSLFDL